MTFSITFDVSDFGKRAERLGAEAKQVPFALSMMLNDAAFNARRALVDTWPRYVTARNASFIGASLHVDRANKGNLQVAIKDVLGRGHLYEQAHGGTVEPTRSRVFAIPITNMVRRGARGVAQADRPRNLLTNNRRAVRITPRGIFVGKGGKLRMMYAFKASVRIVKNVPLVETFTYTMLEEARTGFVKALAYAMATARK